ncbi:MAG: PadR family transcriptional regulator [Acidobacteriota bacterium]|nr:PadR family transcriptional regulator [Acidobacteriota bacterium]
MSLNDRFTAIRKGLLEYVILRIVSVDKVYVADILKRLRETEFATQEGTLYPLLSKMRRDGLVDYEWQESDAGPPRKYYALTASGRAHLAELDDYWKQLNATITQVGK